MKPPVICETHKALSGTLERARAGGVSVGFVPTMGALHAGHASLLLASKADRNFTVASIFVNPLQFGPREDFSRYPRTLDRDMELLSASETDCLFLPSAAEMYPPDFATRIEIPGMSDVLCGATRPGHFSGVLTVVAKLFAQVRPDVAYFGQKDLQQVALIQCMVRDINLGVRIKVCPIMRDADGLALSSRNAYLSPGERGVALALSRALRQAVASYRAGERDADRLIVQARATLATEPELRIDYAALVDPQTLRALARADDTSALALAAWVGGTRLIDNVILGTPGALLDMPA